MLEQSKQGAKSKLIGKKWYNTYNIALHYNAYKTDVYRKSKLVPGAEQMPFQNLLYPLLGNQVLQIGSSTMVGNFSTQDSVSIFSSSEIYSWGEQRIVSFYFKKSEGKKEEFVQNIVDVMQLEVLRKATIDPSTNGDLCSRKLLLIAF